MRGTEENRLLGRHRRRWEDNIKIDIKKSGPGSHGFDFSVSGKGQVACACECGNKIWGSIKRGEFLDKLKNC